VVYIITFAIFQIGSLMSGAAARSSTLIIGRAIAGLGAAGVLNGAILIIAGIVPLRKRPI
jgi:predicted MFS family arabinose efflux permease